MKALMWGTLVALLPFFAACTMVPSADTSDADYAVWETNVVESAAIIIEAAVAEGDLSPAMLDHTKAVLRMAAEGNVAPMTTLADVDGYGAAAVSLLMLNFSGQLGLKVDKAVPPRAKQTLLALADRLDASTVEPPNG